MGRIHWHSNMWADIGSQWDKRRIRNENLIGSKHVNDQGEFERDGYVLVHRRSVWNCPNPPGDDFHQNKSGSYMVPATECKKCAFHRTSQGRIRFPRCVFKAPEDTKKAIANGIESANSLLNAAIKKTSKILNQ